jgi:hypothetical protein
MQRLPGPANLWNCTKEISLTDLGYTAVGTLFTYTVGYRFSASLPPGDSTAHGRRGCAAVQRAASHSVDSPTPPRLTDHPLFKYTGHRLGLIAAMPVIVIGYTSALHRAFLRHVGLMPNGEESIYPNYEETDAPYHIRHEVHDRYIDMPKQKQSVIVFGSKDEMEAALAKAADGLR